MRTNSQRRHPCKCGDKFIIITINQPEIRYLFWRRTIGTNYFNKRRYILKYYSVENRHARINFRYFSPKIGTPVKKHFLIQLRSWICPKMGRGYYFLLLRKKEKKKKRKGRGKERKESLMLLGALILESNQALKTNNNKNLLLLFSVHLLEPAVWRLAEAGQTEASEIQIF